MPTPNDGAARLLIGGLSLDAMQTLLENELLYCATYGPKASYTLPTGESLQWPDWLVRIQAMIDVQLIQNQRLEGPWIISSRARA